MRNFCRQCKTSIPPDDTLCDDCECPVCHGSKCPDDLRCDGCQDIWDEIIRDEIAEDEGIPC